MVVYVHSPAFRQKALPFALPYFQTRSLDQRGQQTPSSDVLHSHNPLGISKFNLRSPQSHWPPDFRAERLTHPGDTTVYSHFPQINSVSRHSALLFSLSGSATTPLRFSIVRHNLFCFPPWLLAQVLCFLRAQFGNILSCRSYVQHKNIYVGGRYDTCYRVCIIMLNQLIVALKSVLKSLNAKDFS